MKELLVKWFLGMVISMVSVDDIVNAIKKLKTDIEAKVAATSGEWDNMAVAAVLGSTDQVLDLMLMGKDLADEKVQSSVNKTDDMIWLPISAKISEVIAALKVAV